ncbi:MAG: glycerol-3-phosphate dehydrogenase/oxidase [Pirellulales bacterium]
MSAASDYSRDRQWDRLESADEPWDIAIIGGGATGVGVAIDAASRGYRVALCEQHDFGKGTSSRSTKLVHGGVRYLKQGHIGLVRSSLRERGLLRQNAPHLVRPLANIVPLYSRWEGPYYGLGMKVYDWLSGRLSLGPSQRLSAADTLARIPTLQPNDLRGGVLYWDAQFDDARLLINMVQTAIDCGATCVNYAPVRELIKEQGRVRGLVVEDAETGRSVRVAARVVVNATGPFSDFVRKLDDPAAEAAIAASQGIHLVFDGRFLPGQTALMVPKTRDGRVIFAIPWHGHTMLGSTDTPIADAPLEPRPQRSEIEFLLETVAPYLSPAPQASDIRSTWAGIRPLIRSGKTANTAKLGRDHVIRVSASGLVSILGGKWTSYRKMAEDGVDRAVEVGGLAPAICRTANLPISGGTDDTQLEQLARSQPGWNEALAPPMPNVAGQVIWAARHEMARSVEDVLARRTRILFLDADAAIAAAPRVAQLLAAELGHDNAWQAEQLVHFRQVAENYRA